MFQLKISKNCFQMDYFVHFGAKICNWVHGNLIFFLFFLIEGNKMKRRWDFLFCFLIEYWSQLNSEIKTTFTQIYLNIVDSSLYHRFIDFYVGWSMVEIFVCVVVKAFVKNWIVKQFRYFLSTLSPLEFC